MQSVLSTSNVGSSFQLSSRSSHQSTRRCLAYATRKKQPNVIVHGRAPVTTVTVALFNKDDKATKAKTTTSSPASGRNLINPKPLYEPGEEPWYIDPKTGKAPGYLQITVFMASQLFVGQVMVPFSIWWQNLFDPIINN